MRGTTMKVITASTPEQQEHVESILTYFQNTILPSFFSISYVNDLLEFGVLNADHLDEYTLKDIMEVTAALQTLQILLEDALEKKHQRNYENQFERNQRIIESHGISFPFSYSDFVEKEICSSLNHAKPQNQWLL